MGADTVSDDLIAVITIRQGRPENSEEVVAICSLTNTSPEPIRINIGAMSSPSLALEIVDDEGKAVLLPPPPVPGGQPQYATLDPNERYVAEYVGFPPRWTPAGSYRVRCRYVTGDFTLHSNWISFELA
jgi:hypothetical protein